MDTNMAITTTAAAGGALVDLIDPDAIAMTMQKVNTFQAIIQKNLLANRDFGNVPGTEKPTLFKSGAEKVCMIFGLVPRYEFLRETADFERGFFDYAIRCTLLRHAEPVAEGVGSCNSHEKKYRYITKTRQQLEEAGVSADAAVSVFTDRWGHAKYRVEDPDIADKANVILKMAKKRAFVDATLQVASLSDLFSQDLEDYAREFVRESTETMTYQEAINLKLPSGKYKGRALKEVWAENLAYIEALRKSDQTDPVIRRAIGIIADHLNRKQAAARTQADAAQAEKAAVIAAQEMQAAPEPEPPADVDPLDDGGEEPAVEDLIPDGLADEAIDFPEFLRDDDGNA